MKKEMMMEAVVLTQLGGREHFHLKQVPIPSPKPGEVKIRIKAAAFNPVDVKRRQGVYTDLTPLILGADCSGVIEELGEGATNFSVGEEVYALSFGQGSNGTYARYLCIDQNFVAKKPSHLSFEAAAAIPLAALTAYRATSLLSSLEKGKALFIAGAAGGVGCFAVQLMRHFYGNLIYTVARSEETIRFLTEHLQFQQEQILLVKNTPSSEAKNNILSLNNGNLFLATFDFVGKEMKKLCTELTDYSGHVVSIVPEDAQFPLSPWSRADLYFQRNLSTHSIFIRAEASSPEPQSWKIYQKQLAHLTHLLNTQKIKVPYWSHVGQLSTETVQKAHALLEAGHVKGKLVMSVD